MATTKVVTEAAISERKNLSHKNVNCVYTIGWYTHTHHRNSLVIFFHRPFAFLFLHRFDFYYHFLFVVTHTKTKVDLYGIFKVSKKQIKIFDAILKRNDLLFLLFVESLVHCYKLNISFQVNWYIQIDERIVKTYYTCVQTTWARFINVMGSHLRL